MRRSFLLCTTLIASVCADDLNRPDQGWHWYEDPEQTTSETFIQKPPLDMPTYQEQVKQALNTAILNPTSQNVLAYLRQQKELMDRSEKFSTVWQQVVLQNPDLNPDIAHPTAQKGRHVYLDQKKKDTAQKIKALSKTHGLLFFFKSDCPYCHAFAPVVKGFSKRYGWTVLAISLDGSQIEDFPDAQTDNGTAKALGVDQMGVPALLAVNPETEEVLPLSYGFVSEQQIIQNIRLWLDREEKI